MVTLSRASLGTGRLQFLNEPVRIEVRGQGSEVRGQGSEVRGAELPPGGLNDPGAGPPLPLGEGWGEGYSKASNETARPSPQPSPRGRGGPAPGDSVLWQRRWRPVEDVLERWRIDDEWWRSRPVSRMYYAVLLDGGTRLEIYQDLVDGQWYAQR